MKILLLAPQPFFQERGTPIAVKLVLKVLAERFGESDRQSGLPSLSKIDLLSYHEGVDIELPGVKIHRIKGCNFIKNVGPGISIKKLICDLSFLCSAIHLVYKNRGKAQYTLVHAVEESVFIAALIKLIFGIPYIYDMDSSIAMQLTEKWWWLKPLSPIFNFFESLAVRNSAAVVPVCDALAVIADSHGSKDTHILRDVSLMTDSDTTTAEANLRKEVKASAEEILILYIGNLESYQGVRLLVSAFNLIADEIPEARLVIIGGSTKDLAEYKSTISTLPCNHRINLLGPRPVASLGSYLSQADILASPRTKGNNTPMKVYSYLHSGKAIIATDLPTHTQVMDNTVSLLVKPDVNDFAHGLKKLLCDSALREMLGKNAYELAESKYTFKIFKERLNELYNRLSKRFSDQSSSIASILLSHLSQI